MSDYQEEVLTNLLDLQAELRGDEPPEHEAKPAAADEPDEVTVAVQDVSISTAPTQSVTERLAALNERLSRLEYEVASVTKRISRIEPDPEAAPVEIESDVDDRWRSFLDLQKIVADRLDRN